jgi:hypothetical protein
MSGHADPQVRPPFSRPLLVEDVPPEGLDLTISATEPSATPSRRRTGWRGWPSWKAAACRAVARDGLAVTGEMRARVTQICVVTLDPFDSEIVEPIDVKFAPCTRVGC